MTEQQQKIKTELLQYLTKIQDKLLKKTIEIILEDHPEFFTGKGARERHHSHKGGLVDHTLEVLAAALKMADLSFFLGPINTDYIIAAVVIHDIGKIFDYARNDKDEQIAEYTFHGSHIFHLSKSHAIWYRYAMHNGLDIKTRENIEHIILAHHGRKEWGSPVEPKTIEAVIVHYSDMLSSQYSIKHGIQTVKQKDIKC